MRGAADRLDPGCAGESADQRFGDFPFQQFGTSRPLGIDDDLGIRNIRDGIQRRLLNGIETGDDRRNEKK